MRYYTNDTSEPFKHREILTDDDAQRKIAQIKENQERRKQGLDYINFSSQETKQVEKEEEEDEQQQQEEEQQQAPPKLSKRNIQENTNAYAYAQQQIQAQVAHFQAERIGIIAQAARKEKHIVYQFPDNPQPPKLGEKKNTKSSLIPIDIYYNEIPNEIYYELDRMRARVSDLNVIKALQTPSFDADGRMSPPVYTKNDRERTGLSDKVFATISEEIDKLNKDIAAKMALWVYGIPKDLLPKLDTSSLTNALEAALYRQMYGIANSSKNLAVS